MMNFRMARPDHLIDLNDLSELDHVRAVERRDRDRRPDAPSPAGDRRRDQGGAAGARAWRGLDRPLRHSPARHARRQPGACRPGGAASAACAGARRRAFVPQRCRRTRGAGARLLPVHHDHGARARRDADRRALCQNAAAQRLGLRNLQPAPRRFRHRRGGRAAYARRGRPACGFARRRRRGRGDAGAFRRGHGAIHRLRAHRRLGGRLGRSGAERLRGRGNAHPGRLPQGAGAGADARAPRPPLSQRAREASR